MNKPVKFAYIMLGKDFNFQEYSVQLVNDYNDASIFGVNSLDDACILAKNLKEKGFECIELCGAFGEIGAKKIIDATSKEIAVGYSIHLKEQDSLFDNLFNV